MKIIDLHSDRANQLYKLRSNFYNMPMPESIIWKGKDIVYTHGDMGKPDVRNQISDVG